MEKSEKKRKHSQENLLQLLTFTAFLFLLALALNAGPVFAPGVEPDQLDPPGGGGEFPPCTIYGFVLDYDAWSAAVNVPVYLHISGGYMVTNSDTGGYFSFHSGGILAETDYLITTNGMNDDALGTWLDNKLWGQRSTIVHTNEEAFATVVIRLQRLNIVDVPAAALFSNTKYATLSYEMTESGSFSHDLSYSVSGPITAGVGYTTSGSVEIGYEFIVSPLTHFKISKRHYAATYWDDRIPGVAKTGVYGADTSWSWDMLPVDEYLRTDMIPNHKEHRVGSGAGMTVRYLETGSTTWSRNSEIPFAIQFLGFGVTIKLDTTVTTTTGASNIVKYEIDRTGDSNTDVLTFWAYTLGTVPLTIPDTGWATGGFELHVWDYSGAG